MPTPCWAGADLSAQTSAFLPGATGTNAAVARTTQNQSPSWHRQHRPPGRLLTLVPASVFLFTTPAVVGVICRARWVVSQHRAILIPGPPSTSPKIFPPLGPPTLGNTPWNQNGSIPTWVYPHWFNDLLPPGRRCLFSWHLCSPLCIPEDPCSVRSFTPHFCFSTLSM